MRILKDNENNLHSKFMSFATLLDVLIFAFIAFYGVMGTLSHSKIILELLLQNDKPKAFSEGGYLPLNPPPPEGETPSIPPP